MSPNVNKWFNMMSKQQVEPRAYPLLVATDGFEEFDHQLDEISSARGTALSQEFAGRENRVISNIVKKMLLRDLCGSQEKLATSNL